jgi:flavin reductase (DIM6/NTAB) family NADH-FMN oxidoreductase RutF
VTHGICINGDGSKKDTLRNIESTGQWVMNTVSEWYLPGANQTSGNYASGVDETKEAGLAQLPCAVVTAPRLAQAPVSMECTLEFSRDIYNVHGMHTTTLLVGRVVHVHVHKAVLKDDARGGSLTEEDAATGSERPVVPLVDLEKLRAVGRAGDITYWPVGSGGSSSMPRPVIS